MTDERDAGAQGRRSSNRRRLLTLSALLVPLIFFVVVAIGIASMLFGRLSLFRPGKSHPAETTVKPGGPGQPR